MILISPEECVKTTLQIITNRTDQLIWLNNFKLLTEILDHKLSEEDIFLKAVMKSMTYLEMTLSSQENEQKLLETNNEKLMRGYSAQTTVSGRV